MFFSILLTINCFGGLFLPEHPNLSEEPPASWIKEISAVETDSVHSTQRGDQYLLLDAQINRQACESYFHTVRKVLEGGLEEASKYEIQFDPSYESITIHKLALIRGGQAITTQNDARLLQRELSLENHVCDGMQSLVLLLSDVREGDVIEFAYTRKGQNPIFENHFSEIRRVSFSERIEKLYYRILHQKKFPLFAKLFNLKVPLVEEKFDEDHIELSLLMAPTEVIDAAHAPYWYHPEQEIQVTEFKTWQEVSEWGATLFELGSEDHKKIRNLIDPWLSKDASKEMMILNALNFVQNEIRYLGMEESIYAFHPHDPLATLAQRYGDCKDKTLLLKLILKEMGIESFPCLVSTQYLDCVKDFLPSPTIFDHAILQVILDGQSYWLDPTRRYQGGSLKDYSQEFYGCYLVLNREENCLIQVLPHRNKQAFEVNSHFKLNKTRNELDLTLIYKEVEANYIRAHIAYEGKEKLAESFSNYYSSIHGRVEAQDFKIEDDRENNFIKIRVNFVLKEIEEGDKVSIAPLLIGEYLPPGSSPSQKHPLAISFPLEIRETIRVTSVGAESDAKNLEYDLPSFHFQFEKFNEDKDFVLRYSLQTKTDHVLPEDFKTLRKTLSKINEDLNYNFYKDVAEELAAAKELEDSIAVKGAFVLLGIIAIGILSFILRRAFKEFSEEELTTDIIRKRWKKAFWIYYGVYIAFFGLVLISAAVFNPSMLVGILIFQGIFGGWAFLLYRKSYLAHGNIILGITITFLFLMIFNPLAAFFLIRSIKLFRYNRRQRKLQKTPLVAVS